MARVYKCDRCGIVYNELPETCDFFVTPSEGHNDPFMIGSMKACDLCEKCSRDLSLFMSELDICRQSRR